MVTDDIDRISVNQKTQRAQKSRIQIKTRRVIITSLTPSRVRKDKKNTTKNLTFAWTSEMGESYAQETLTLSIVLDYSEHEDSESGIR